MQNKERNGDLNQRDAWRSGWTSLVGTVDKNNRNAFIGDIHRK